MKTAFKIVTTCLISLMNAILVLPTLANDSSSKKAPDPDCPIEYFYRGYDYAKGNPATSPTDPGWRLDIMLSKRNDHCLTCSYAEACEADYFAYEMEGEVDYYYRLYARAEVSGGSEGFLKDTAFTGSGEFEYQRQDVFGFGLVNIQAEGSCQIFDGGRDPYCYDLVFTPGFLNAMAEFPISTSEPGWFDKVENFFIAYGTHIIADYASLGARWAYESQLTQASYEGLRASDVNIQMAAEVSAEFYRTKGASAEYESEEQTELRLMFDGAVERQRAITVGAPPPSDIDFGEWANNIENPIPQEFNLKPISELLTTKIFPDDPNIELKRQVMEAGYELYCDAVPGCGVPKPPKIIRVTEREEGKYPTQNAASVACPANYQLISGGCKTDPLPAEPYYWMLPSLKPMENAYHCIASMDVNRDAGGIPNYHRGLTANATCLHKEYIKDIVTTHCEGPIGQYDSECAAYCPAGYQVTGGGCESDSLNEVYPWKVTTSNPVYGGEGSLDSWICRAAEDVKTGQYNKKTRGYAICVQYEEAKVKDSKIKSERSGTSEQYTNGGIVDCDLGYEVLGGGCSTPSYDTFYEWKIVETQPSRDNRGWSCLAQEDYGTGLYYQDVQTDALCVKFN